MTFALSSMHRCIYIWALNYNCICVMCTCVRAFSIIRIHTVLISRAVFIHVRWNNFSETRLLWVYMCVSRKKSLVNVIGSSIMLLVNVSYVIDIDVTSLPKRWWNGHDRQDVRRELFASREFVREIHSCSFYNRLASINHRYIHSLPLSLSLLPFFPLSTLFIPTFVNSLAFPLPPNPHVHHLPTTLENVSNK